MSPVDFKKWPCRMSLYFLKPCRMSLGPLSHVEFKKQPCCPVDFRGQGPYSITLRGEVDVGPLTWKGGGVPMSHVEFKKCQYILSFEWPRPVLPLRCSHVACRI